ncbi:MAG: ester cyclase [Anaerolineae bacterium]|nr:ester cyclase [Anaerolineae bacterium]
MSTEAKKAIIRRYFDELWSQGNLVVASELIASDYAVHDPGTPGRQGGIEGEKQAANLYRTAFPDLHFTIESEVAEGDSVMVRWHSRGTHLGELMGLPPTGRQANPTGISVFRLVNGRIAEHWCNWDTLGLMQQLGLIPQPEVMSA